jgi:hypothetical protein
MGFPGGGVHARNNTIRAGIYGSEPNYPAKQVCSKENFSMFAAIIIDSLWKLRNSVVFQNKHVNLQEFPIKVAKSHEENSRAYNSSDTQIPNTGFTAMQQWIKPPSWENQN